MSLAEAKDMFTRPELSDLERDLTSRKLSPADGTPIHKLYSLQIYKLNTTEVSKSSEEGGFWNSGPSYPVACFVGMVQASSCETTTSQNANASVSYSVLLAILSFSKEWRRYLIAHHYIQVGLLPFSISKSLSSREELGVGHKNVLLSSSITPLMDSIRAAYPKARKDAKLHIPQNAVQQILQPLRIFLHSGFTVHI